jgi:hypothetical protein
VEEYLHTKTDQNAVVELVDMLFFIIALYQLFGISLDTLHLHYSRSSMAATPQAFFYLIIRMEECVPWKHWADYQSFESHIASEILENFVRYWKHQLKEMKISHSILINIFHQKQKINLDRQKSGYKTKTEEDNESIKI